jgi:hypothetical protein
MWDAVKNVLELVAEYGAATVFMALFAVLYIRSQRKNEKLQESRLADSKKALEALIEARHAIDEAHDVGETISDEVRQNRGENKEEFGRVRGKLDRLEVKVDDVKEAVKKD